MYGDISTIMIYIVHRTWNAICQQMSVELSPETQNFETTSS